ncbi:NADPH-dependent curcumin reductase CurA [Streptomyces canus]|nr:NADPH-dependent curcumin reductase CurA [Streptomyces canus]
MRPSRAQRLPELHRHTSDAFLAMLRGEGVGKMVVKL